MLSVSFLMSFTEFPLSIFVLFFLITNTFVSRYIYMYVYVYTCTYIHIYVSEYDHRIPFRILICMAYNKQLLKLYNYYMEDHLFSILTLWGFFFFSHFV